MFYYNKLKHIGNQVKEEKSWNMITIDGVVGVGKSTLMDILVDEMALIPFQEPVVDNPILDRFYYDRARFSFPLQIFFLNERFKHIKKAGMIDNAVLDRSIYGDLIFAKMLQENDEMSLEEFNIYLDLFHNMIEHCQPPRLMVYLEISTDGAIKRIQRRGRDYELDTEKDYWLRLNNEYRDYFNQYAASPILRIEADDLNFEDSPEDREYIITLIKNKLDDLTLAELGSAQAQITTPALV